jgi:predicted Zn-dependent protease
VSASHIALLVAVLLLAPAAPAEETIEHRIPPGYKPEQKQDEKGLWLEVEEYEKSVQKSALLVKDPAINNYVNAIACRVAGAYCRDFRVYVIRNPGFNASMAPNGMLQVWTGLLLRAQTTDEVAAVIGHEISHYTRLHTLARMQSIKGGMTAGSVFDIGFAVLTGVPVPIGQLTALLNTLAFSREQEREADLLGTMMIADAAYDPHASYQIWEDLIAEEEAAVVKREEPGIFSQTHPDAEDRAERLKGWVNTHFGPPDAELFAGDWHLEFLNRNYLLLMEDQIDTNRFGRTQALLERHGAIGVRPALLHYFYGEMFRQRGRPDDGQRAIDAYRHAIEDGEPPPATYKNLAYLYLKAGDTGQARDEFRHYLELVPDASDRAMIEFYLQDDGT